MPAAVKEVGEMYSVADMPARDSLETWKSAFKKYVASYFEKHQEVPRYVQYAPNAPSGFGDWLVHELELKLAGVKCTAYCFWMSAQSSGKPFDMRWFHNRDKEDGPEDTATPAPAVVATPVAVEYDDEDDDGTDAVLAELMAAPEPMFNYDSHTRKLYMFVNEDHPSLEPGHYYIERLDIDDVGKIDDLTDEQAMELQATFFKEYKVYKYIYEEEETE
jgi:hypothetical protein